MSRRAKRGLTAARACRAHAAQCEKLAKRALRSGVKRQFRDVARQYRELADAAERSIGGICRPAAFYFLPIQAPTIFPFSWLFCMVLAIAGLAVFFRSETHIAIGVVAVIPAMLLALFQVSRTRTGKDHP